MVPTVLRLRLEQVGVIGCANLFHSLILNVLESVTLSDIYFGDVYVCSGQSNMQMTVKQSAYGVRSVVYDPYFCM